jgi:hypothetical protein
MKHASKVVSLSVATQLVEEVKPVVALRAAQQRIIRDMSLVGALGWQLQHGEAALAG